MKKAQIKSMENIAILVIFFLLIGMSLIVYAKFQKIGIAQAATDAAGFRAIDLSQKAAFLPEIACTQTGISGDITTDVDCFDLVKVKYASDLIQENTLDYFDIFGYSAIWIEEIYPENSFYVIYNYSINKTDLIPTQIPVILFDVRDGLVGANAFGVLHVQSYK